MALLSNVFYVFNTLNNMRTKIQIAMINFSSDLPVCARCEDKLHPV